MAFLLGRRSRGCQDGAAARSLAWRRGGKGEAPALARLAMGHRASGGSSAGAGGVESTRGLVLPCHSPRRQMELLGGRRHKSPSSHPARIKYGPQTSTMLPLGSPPSASLLLSDRPCPTCLSLVTLKKEELAMGGWEEAEEGEGRGRVDSAPMRSLFMSFTPQNVVAWCPIVFSFV